MSDALPPDAGRVSRRGLFAGFGAAGVMGLGAVALAQASRSYKESNPLSHISPFGLHQAGVSRPNIPQQHCLICVVDIQSGDPTAWLGSLSQEIASLTAAPSGNSLVTPDGVGDLTITVGLGARPLSHSRHPEFANQLRLPLFKGDSDLDPGFIGGDVFISVNASDPIVLAPTLARVIGHLPSPTVRWQEFGFRGQPVRGVVRNSLGYFDGIIEPRTETELDDNVWIGSGPLKGGTICVIRKFALDAVSFSKLDQAQRDKVFGRRQLTGAPLSGGNRDEEINLDAKEPDGTLKVPEHSHARAAHPSFTGSGVMLRRGYSFRSEPAETGHLFVSFQNDVSTFVKTQLRLDEGDLLSEFATPLATAAFAVLPGFNVGRPLGSGLFD
ncbi:MAG: Dyp-type peroxidase [Microbacteriaceae bacterium]|nr:Dyp-type peroxidase [Microbacteriaceae bacterium]